MDPPASNQDNPDSHRFGETSGLGVGTPKGKGRNTDIWTEVSVLRRRLLL
jgi:hypothetical protein